MRKIVVAGCLFSLFLAGTGLAWAQNQTPTAEQVLARSWARTHEKLLDIAKDFPEDKFDYRPHPDARNFLEEIWHVTAGVQFTIFRMKGEQVDGRKLFSYEGRSRNRAEYVADLEKAINECNELMKVKFDPRNISFLEHQGEHFGKLVTFYRANGLVPPSSRD